MLNINYNPDVLSCLANLSNDEVFTPPNLVNDILDMLPQELFQSKETTFLDPVSKSGVFLREIAERLIKGLENEITDHQERINHIFTKQLYGIAITELTSLLSRRSVYCSKIANGKYSVCDDFVNEAGNIKFDYTQHTWQNGNCKFCGASKEVYSRPDDLETHAYQFIHTVKPETIFNMKFDVIIGNPPYQLNDGGAGASASPLYHKFIQQSKKLNPRYLSMIIPSRWFAGGKGLDEFRKEMLNDTKLSYLNDFINAKECFPGISIGGGVCYFLWDKQHDGPCEIVNTANGKSDSMHRFMNEYSIFIRNNKALKIIKKIQLHKEKSISSFIESRNPFGFPSSSRGDSNPAKGNIILHSSKGNGYVSISAVTQGQKHLSKHKIMFSKVTSEHAGEPDKSGMFRVLSSVQILPPNHVCTDSYLIAGSFVNIEEAKNFEKYLKSKFARYLLLQAVTSINLSKDKFDFIPTQDFTKTMNDDFLFKKYKLNDDEIETIECLMKEID
jgi:site-specific DNA-methyltransferase (adenine-specific)